MSIEKINEERYNITADEINQLKNGDPGDIDFIRGFIEGVLRTTCERYGGTQHTLEQRIVISQHITNFFLDAERMVPLKSIGQIATTLEDYLDEKILGKSLDSVIHFLPGIVRCVMAIIHENKIPEHHIINVYDQIKNQLRAHISAPDEDSARIAGDLWAAINFAMYGHPVQFLYRTSRYTGYYKNGDAFGVASKEVSFTVIAKADPDNQASEDFVISVISVDYPETAKRPRTSLIYNREGDVFTMATHDLMSFTKKQVCAIEEQKRMAQTEAQKLQEYNQEIAKLREDVQASIEEDEQKQAQGLDIEDVMVEKLAV